jgi:LacI family transcriptional regulator
MIMKKKQFTIKEIARLADVSPSAVSIALNNREGISTTTRERILALVEKLEYVPNQQARRLLLKYTNNIGVIHEQQKSPLQHLFLMSILSSALSAGEALGYNFIIAPVLGNKNNRVPDIVKHRDVDGIMVIGELQLEVLSDIKKYGIPTVLVDEHLREEDTIAIEADYKQGASLALKYLVEKGHRQIAYIGVARERNYGDQTFSGFMNGLLESGLSVQEELLFPVAQEETEEAGYRAMKKVLTVNVSPTAVFCAADIFAIGAIRAVKEEGYRVPQDISVIGMDNIILAQYIEPTLTTVRFNMNDMGKLAIDILIKMIKGEYSGKKKIFFKGYLVERSSVVSLPS